MGLNGKSTSRMRGERHQLRLFGPDRQFNIIAVQMQDSPSVGVPTQFDRIASLNLDDLQITGNSAILDPQVKMLQAA